MNNRIEDAIADTKALPPAPAHIREAIEDGSATVRIAANTAQDHNANSSAISAKYDVYPPSTPCT